MKRLLGFAPVLFFIAAVQMAAQDTVVIGGSGAVGDAVELLAKAYKRAHPGNSVDANGEAMANTGGVGGVKSGKYKYYGEVGFVTTGEPKGTVKKFIDYVMSPDGENIWEKFGMAVVR